MKKITLIAAFITMTASFALAQVTKGTIGNGNYTDWEGKPSTEYGLDFDNDGNLEAVLKTGYDEVSIGEGWDNGSVVYEYGTMELVVGERWDLFKLLNAGDSVGVSSDFGGEGDCSFGDYAAVSTSASYVGFKIIKGESTYYGYAKVHKGTGEIIWDEIYYEATAGKAITVGDTGTPSGIDNVFTNSTPEIRKVMIEGIIYIERDGQLYDINGRQVK